MTENTENMENTGSIKEKESSFNLLREVWEWFYTIVIALVVVFFIKTFIFDIVRVDGPSMYPTLVHNDRLVITKLGYEPETGDIIILDSAYKNREEYFESYEEATGDELNILEKTIKYFTLPENLKHRYYVKRIIGLPGDTVDIKNGKVLLNGEILDEPYYEGITGMTDALVDYPVTVEEGHVFVMGDNRPNSKDSRSSDLGQVPIKAISGKSQFRIWPFSAFGKTE